MALKERLAECDVLDTDARLVTADGEDAVHQQERIAVGKEPQDILRSQLRQGFIGSVHCMCSSPLPGRAAIPRSRASLASVRNSRMNARTGLAGVPIHCCPAGTSCMTPLCAASCAPSPTAI